jgi:hypothetical protein
VTTLYSTQGGGQYLILQLFTISTAAVTGLQKIAANLKERSENEEKLRAHHDSSNTHYRR